MLAVGRMPRFFITATHSTIAAPELSMQLSIVCAGQSFAPRALLPAAPLIVSS